MLIYSEKLGADKMVKIRNSVQKHFAVSMF